jgi:nucleoid-associated protein YgaU
MTRENKVALVVGFALVLFVGILVSDHLSKAQTQRSAQFIPAVNRSQPAAERPVRFVNLQTPDTPRPASRAIVPTSAPATTPAVDPEPVASEPPPPAAIAGSGSHVYEVKAGESLSTICHRVYGEVSLTEALAAHNGISNPDMLWAGKRLTLPPLHVLTANPGDASPGGGDAADDPGTYRVVEGDSLSSIAQRVLGSAAQWHQLYELNRQAITNPDTVRAGTVLKIPAG